MGAKLARLGNHPVVSIHTKQEWDRRWLSHKESNKLMVIDFSASWCGPCRSMEPVVKAMAAKYTDVEFVRIDINELSDLAQQWGVEAVPTFVLVKEGKEVGRVVGADKEELQEKIEQLRVDAMRS